MNSKSERVLILIVCYQAEQHLASVLDRIPSELINDPNIEILIMDDGSSDAGAEVGREWAEAHHLKNITVLRNQINQGYGGNQKIGYRMAIDTGFDFVVLLHGDGQYAPELLPQFIKTWKETKTDIILGSRMHDLRSARNGGMPWYKIVGNSMLTKFQNTLTGNKLSEYHTGYRGYATNFLRNVPFEINTNDFHFDTEILLQGFHVGARIKEIPIPTHYGSEICRVNGIQYAKNVLFATLRFKMHQFGMLCDLKYRRTEPEQYTEKNYMANSSHSIALKIIEGHHPRRLLDLGCGPSFIAKQCQKLGVEVASIDLFDSFRGAVDQFCQLDLESNPTLRDAFRFDIILLLDTIERFANPERLLLNLRNRGDALSADLPLPILVLSTPNIAFAAIRLNLLFGRFNYAERGILDITHKRLFTRRSLLHMLHECGYTVEKIYPAAVPFQAVMKGYAGKILQWLATRLANFWPNLFAFQFVVACRPKPGVAQLIRWSEKHHMASRVMSNYLNIFDENKDV